MNLADTFRGGGGVGFLAALGPRRHRLGEAVRVREFALVGAVRVAVWRSGRRLGGWVAVVVGVLVLVPDFGGYIPMKRYSLVNVVNS